MKIKCVKHLNDKGEETESGWLTVGKTYNVLEVFASKGVVEFRVDRGDGGAPALFDARQFVIVSNKIPSNWCFKYETERYFSLTPCEWARDGFWEAFFDGNQEAEKIFDEVSQRISKEEPLDAEEIKWWVPMPKPPGGSD